MDGALDEHDLSGMANGSARGHLILAEVVNDALTKHKQVWPGVGAVCCDHAL